MVLAESIRARKSAAVAWSMSKTAHPAGIPSLFTFFRSALFSSEGATTAPCGRMSFLPALVRSSFAMATRSRSTSEVPTSKPIAAKKVHAMAPPMRIWSTRGRSDSITSIFPEILAPPRIATKGRLGLASASPRYCNSFCIRKPATAGLRMWATPSVDACARWADPKASLTYKSPRAAKVRARPGSFCSSPGQKRVFSTRATPPRGKRLVAGTPVAGSGMNSTGAPNNPSRVGRICAREYLGSGPPAGRPKCDSRITRAPCSRR